MSRTENDAGYRDGYRVGPDALDPDGNPVTIGYDPDMFVSDDYRAGLAEGRSDRIDEALIAKQGERP